MKASRRTASNVSNTLFQEPFRLYKLTDSRNIQVSICLICLRLLLALLLLFYLSRVFCVIFCKAVLGHKYKTQFSVFVYGLHNYCNCRYSELQIIPMDKIGPILPAWWRYLVRLVCTVWRHIKYNKWNEELTVFYEHKKNPFCIVDRDFWAFRICLA